MEIQRGKTIRAFPRVKKGEPISAAIVNQWAAAIEELCNQTRLSSASPELGGGFAGTRPFDVSASVSDGKIVWSCPRGIVYGDGCDTRVITELAEREGEREIDASTYYALLLFPMCATVRTLGRLAAVKVADMTYNKYSLIQVSDDPVRYAPDEANPEEDTVRGGEAVVRTIEAALTYKVFSGANWKPTLRLCSPVETGTLASDFRSDFPIDETDPKFDGFYRALWTCPVAEITVSPARMSCAVNNLLRSDFFLFGQNYAPTP